MFAHLSPEKIITTQEYNLAVERIYDLMQRSLPEDSAEYVELDILSRAVDEYESIKFPFLSPDPSERIAFRKEQMNCQ